MSRKTDVYKQPDRFTKMAKQAGYPARSVFKLEEIDRRVRLLRPGMRVLDLGAAPGSWSMYVAQKIGPSGRLLSIDLKPLGVGLPSWCEIREGDALTTSNEDLATFAPYDIVLSDMAPSTTGNRLGDQTRSFELFMRALAVADTLTKVGGAFVGKIFMGEDLPLARAEMKKIFAEDRLIRPEGTRTVSYELFGVGLNKRPVRADVAKAQAAEAEKAAAAAKAAAKAAQEAETAKPPAVAAKQTTPAKKAATKTASKTPAAKSAKSSAKGARPS